MLPALPAEHPNRPSSPQRTRWTDSLHRGIAMPDIAQPRLHHLAITVTDLDASVDWYSTVFGIKPMLDVPHEGGLGRLLTTDDWQLVIALHRHDSNDGGQFAETTTGLDHGGFVVPSRVDLEQWQQHLESNGVERAERADRPLTQSAI